MSSGSPLILLSNETEVFSAYGKFGLDGLKYVTNQEKKNGGLFSRYVWCGRGCSHQKGAYDRGGDIDSLSTRHL
jgi:hypothetical protein